MMRLDYQDAKAFNPHGPRIFLFFLLQLVARISLLITLGLMSSSRLRFISLADAIASFLLFLWLFWPFIYLLIFHLQ